MSRAQKFVDQQQPKSRFPFANFIFSNCEIWVRGGGLAQGIGGQRGGLPPPSSYGCQPF